MNGFTGQNKPPGVRRENGHDGERLQQISVEEEKPELLGGESEGKFEQVEVIQHCSFFERMPSPARRAQLARCTQTPARLPNR